MTANDRLDTRLPIGFATHPNYVYEVGGDREQWRPREYGGDRSGNARPMIDGDYRSVWPFRMRLSLCKAVQDIFRATTRRQHVPSGFCAENCSSTNTDRNIFSSIRAAP